jgi:hypothetical protein
VAGGWRKVLYVKIRSLHYSPGITRMRKIKVMKYYLYIYIYNFGGIARRKETTRKT